MEVAPTSVQPLEWVGCMPPSSCNPIRCVSAEYLYCSGLCTQLRAWGMLGSLTCVRLLSTVSKTGAIMEKSAPGELISWLDLRRAARSQHVQGMQKAEGRKALSFKADPFGHHVKIPISGRQGALGEFLRRSPRLAVANLSGLAGRGVPASSPILSRSMAVHCCIMRVTPLACST